ncbi:MAG: DUF2723 domain-containing protein [Chloroflexota bacterium]
MERQAETQENIQRKRLWPLQIGVVIVSALAAFYVYLISAAPGLTWAHHGQDGGEFLAAAMTNGVPHPPGYPLYILLLQGWFRLVALIHPLWSSSSVLTSIAWYGNLFSGVCAALSVGVTTSVATKLLQTSVGGSEGATGPFEGSLAWSGGWPSIWPNIWGAVVGLAWAISPLLWGQAIITEVYALHALLISLLGWVLFNHQGKPTILVPIIALGVANHLTFVLLLPAVLYYRYFCAKDDYAKNIVEHLLKSVIPIAIGGILGMLFFIRIPWVTGVSIGGLSWQGNLSPVNWGYADNWEGLWWLVSGNAYQGYLFGIPAENVFKRVTTWGNTLTTQYTPVGLGLALLGLSQWDTHQPHLRNFILLWIFPVSIYSISYYTSDSDIYLLSVTWIMLVPTSVGIRVAMDWLTKMIRQRFSRANQRKQAMHSLIHPLIHGSTSLVILCACIAIMWVRYPILTLHMDTQAEAYVDNVLDVVEPSSIIISNGDRQTFALWYAAWATGELLDRAPDAVIVNQSLYQFAWYRRLIQDIYPHVPDIDQDLLTMIDTNKTTRPVFLGEKLEIFPKSQLKRMGHVWRYVPNPE